MKLVIVYILQFLRHLTNSPLCDAGIRNLHFNNGLSYQILEFVLSWYMECNHFLLERDLDYLGVWVQVKGVVLLCALYHC